MNLDLTEQVKLVPLNSLYVDRLWIPSTVLDVGVVPDMSCPLKPQRKHLVHSNTLLFLCTKVKRFYDVVFL